MGGLPKLPMFEVDGFAIEHLLIVLLAGGGWEVGVHK